VLYGYPVQATANNWLHNCLEQVLALIHASLLANDQAPEWPEIIPAQFRPQLRSRIGMRDRLVAYKDAASALTPDERLRVLDAFTDQNQIAHLLNCAGDGKTVRDLPEQVREPISKLFSYSFNLLAELGVRDECYRMIYSSTAHHVCAFCGLEYFEAPGAPREALDHYLAKSLYPFAAANLHNLVPMGHKCNSNYKLSQDILRGAGGVRRRSFDPYGIVTGIKISLSHSEPFAGKDGHVPAWNIEFDPDSEEVTTWDAVFRIRSRYTRDILDEEFKNWLKNFWDWCRRAKISLDREETLLDTLKRYAGWHEDFGLSDRSFLKAAMFHMLLKHCEDGDARLIQLLLGPTE
jgi:hypothetical protein